MSRYFIIAGEASGDIHAAGLIEALRRCEPRAEVRFFGGDLMASAAGREPEVHYREMAYMGFSEVLRHLPDVRRNLARAKEVIDTWHPHAIILVDYPSFNLRIASYARHNAHAHIYYYISPKVWAWKEHRVKAMRRYIDKVFSILPFEPEWFHSRGFDKVQYVGNPSVHEVDERLARLNPLRESDLLALLPGSRRGEIRNNLPVMLEVARRHPEMRAVVSLAPGIEPEFYEQFGALELAPDSFALMASARAALVTSGTATLECALCNTPQVACYRGNGSRLTYDIMSRWLKIPYVTLPNLIAGSEIIPEMLMHHCNTDEVDTHLTPLLSNTPERSAMLAGYAHMRGQLGTSNPADTTATAIITNLKQ